MGDLTDAFRFELLDSALNNNCYVNLRSFPSKTSWLVNLILPNKALLKKTND